MQDQGRVVEQVLGYANIRPAEVQLDGIVVDLLDAAIDRQPGLDDHFRPVP